MANALSQRCEQSARRLLSTDWRCSLALPAPASCMPALTPSRLCALLETPQPASESSSSSSNASTGTNKRKRIRPTSTASVQLQPPSVPAPMSAPVSVPAPPASAPTSHTQLSAGSLEWVTQTQQGMRIFYSLLCAPRAIAFFHRLTNVRCILLSLATDCSHCHALSTGKSRERAIRQ